MMWRPEVTIHKQPSDEEKKEAVKQYVEDIYNIPRHPISDTSQFIVASTTIDKQTLKDPLFAERFEDEILSIDKFAPLSQIDALDQQYTRLIWMDMIFAKRMGMTDRAKRKALEIVRIYNESRGRDVFSRKLLSLSAKNYLLVRNRKKKHVKVGSFLDVKNLRSRK